MFISTNSTLTTMTDYNNNEQHLIIKKCASQVILNCQRAENVTRLVWTLLSRTKCYLHCLWHYVKKRRDNEWFTHKQKETLTSSSSLSFRSFSSRSFFALNSCSAIRSLSSHASCCLRLQRKHGRHCANMAASVPTWLLLCQHGRQWANMAAIVPTWLPLCQHGRHCANMAVQNVKTPKI